MKLSIEEIKRVIKLTFNPSTIKSDTRKRVSKPQSTN